MYDEGDDGVWCAFLELRAVPGTSAHAAGVRGAYVTLFVRCDTPFDFVVHASRRLKDEGYLLAGVENLKRTSDESIWLDDVHAELVRRTCDHPVQWATFHQFKHSA